MVGFIQATILAEVSGPVKSFAGGVLRTVMTSAADAFRPVVISAIEPFLKH
jgi:hypothetical protein